MATASIAKSSPAFLRFAGVCGIVTAISSLLYTVFFLLLKGPAHDLLPLGLGDARHPRPSGLLAR